VLISPPGVYEEQLMEDLNQVKNYFVGIAEASPVPVYV